MTGQGPQCCLVCGRWGNRAYRPADDGAEGSVCTNDRACYARARRAGYPLPRWAAAQAAVTTRQPDGP